MKTEFDVSFEKNGVCQARIVVAKNKDFAERWFRMIEPEAVVLRISENYEYKPGKPVEEVPYEWNGIVFDDVFDDKYSSERILYFDVRWNTLVRITSMKKTEPRQLVQPSVSRSIQNIRIGLNLDLKFLQPTQTAVTSIGCSTTWIATSMKNL